MFNIVLCDDNKGFMSLFKSLLNKHFEKLKDDKFLCKIGGCFGSGIDLLEYIKTLKVDVLFLDIDMPELSGFDVARTVSQKYSDTLIIFMSAYDNFVYESFDYLPFAYMRKEKITEDLPKITHRIKGKLLEQTRYITIYTSNKEFKVDTREILYFESTRNYYIIHLTNGTELSCRGTISQLEITTKALGFFRTHSAFLVNLEHADRVTAEGYILIGNREVPIAQKRAKEFKKAYLEFTRRHIGI